VSAGSARLAVAGLGRMGLRHARNAAASPRIELVAVADADRGRAEEVAAELGARAYDDAALERLLRDERPDGLCVVTPTPTHAPLIELAAAHGVHVFCEKPLAHAGPAAARALDVAQRAGVAVQVGFQMRFDPDLAALAGLIERGELGDRYQLRASLRDPGPPSWEYLAASGGYYRDAAIHVLDLARWLMGEVDEVSAFGAVVSDPRFAELGDIDTTAIVLRFASGALGLLDGSRVAGYGFETGVEVIGSAATARVPGARADGVELLSSGRIGARHTPGFLERFDRAYPLELDAFAAVALGAGPPLVTGEDGLAAMRLAEACDVSRREGRTVRAGAGSIGW
jgi:myo-inositol 2-dehydrogenase/D-chiro-inositol 1-dehydrogenase